MQERCNSIANTLELCLSCTNPFVCCYISNFHMGVIINPGAKLNDGLALSLKNIPGNVVYVQYGQWVDEMLWDSLLILNPH